MSHPFVAYCDDFYINVRLGSQLQLSHSRDVMLHFFEQMTKAFPGLCRFRKQDSGEMTLEEDRSSNSYRWVSLESKRLQAGHVNPTDIAESMRLHTTVMQAAPYQLGISPIEIDYLDVLFGFDMEFKGNHDEIIAESLLPDSPLSCLLDEPNARAIDFQPSVTVSLSDDLRMQGRVDVVTRTNSYQVRTGEYSDDVISVHFVLRRYWGDRPKQPLESLVVDLA
ncbi:MAG TPA: hypothetical protein PLD59_14895, partial [Tepidisphaeraceae bacterium]|nr:hypothetical protein [Tepidisphaeraceae bacterium]